MKIVDLEQGSEVWKEWRTCGIGASDIPIIMGTLPTKYKTPYQLWQIKCGITDEDPPNKAMYHGMQYEEFARQWLCKEMELDLKPYCVQHDEHAHFRASLDGYDINEEILLEIKCPMTISTIDNARTAGAVHSYWIDQVLWQMYLTDCKEAYIAIFDYREEDCIVIRIERDEGRIQKMVEKAHEFWDAVKFYEPPALADRELKEVSNSELEALLAEYRREDDTEKRSKKRKEILKMRIIDYMEGDGIVCHGDKVYTQVNPVSYDYKAMEEDGIDLEKYRKPRTESVRIRLSNKKVINFEEI